MALLFLTSCESNGVFEKTHFFPAHQWESSTKPLFKFTITDTLSLYHIYAVVRHEDAYRYNNLWINFTTQSPSDTAKSQLLNLRLADNRRGWLGTGMDDIFDHRIRITQAPIKLKAGDYHFSIQQAMRENPISHILNAGIRVEKIAK
ncbi:MAG: gliding motility lipoprotein GldH [Chitinophagaceae bacterium]|jgi:gliding motility-associated lipoprotein GldH|nr:gliding motility lipoprotein GldH [Chitinophagaceae bacterium]